MLVLTGEFVIVVSTKFLSNNYIGNGHFDFWYIVSAVKDIFELESRHGVILNQTNYFLSDWTVMDIFPNYSSSLILREFSEVSHSQLLSILHHHDSASIILVLNLELFLEISSFDKLKIANVVTSFLNEFACVLGEI
jgi:hypothetical protein